jgi:hypothetical protein
MQGIPWYVGIWMAPLPAQINRGMTPEKKKVWN